jgi:Zn-dependent protease with chaperone function
MIRAACEGKVRNIPVLSDELLFITPLVPFILLSPLFLINDPSTFAVILLVLLAVMGMIPRFIILRNRAIRLTEHEAPVTYAALRQELSRQPSFRRKPLLYWAPNDHGRGARVLGGFRSKILLTGGTVVENEESPRTAAVILRHEIAHIRAGDTRMYVYFLLLIANALAALIRALDGSSSVLLSAVIGLSLNFFFYFAVLLRRREYLADARAVNASDSSEEYVTVLLRRSSPESGGLFHPTNDERAGAVRYESPVLRRSLFIVIFAILFIVLNAKQLARPSRGGAVDPFVFLLFLISSAAPIMAIMLELLKGGRAKHPLAAHEEPSVRMDILKL